MAATKLPETELGLRLAEALRTEPSFCNWLLKQVGAVLPDWRQPLHLLCVKDDTPDPSLDNRRTDLWVEFSDTSDRTRRTHLLFGELKILAPFGAGQAAAYWSRAERACSGRMCRHAASVIIAPRRYLAGMGTDGDYFPAKVSLEEIKAFFDEPAAGLEDASVERYVFYRTVIARALADEAEGYVPLGDAMREQQFRWYRIFVEDYKPHLVVHDRKGSKQSYDIQLDTAVRGFGYIKHRLFEGKVVIELMRWADRFDALNQLAQSTTGGTLVVEHPPNGRAGTGLHLRFKDAITPRLTRGRSFAEQHNQVQEAIDAADALWQWTKANRIKIEALVP